MKVLVDTSVWINHFRKGSLPLTTLLEAEEVLVHPFVIGELACGQLRYRAEVLALLSALPGVTTSSDEEVLFLIEKRGLMGRGLGLVDVHLLGSCLTDHCLLWTVDNALAVAARELNVAVKGPC